MIFGGHLKDIPEPHLRLWDRPRVKGVPYTRRWRRLTITVMQYAGFPHYFVSMRQEINPIWDNRPDPNSDQQGVWRKCWDDEQAEGLLISSGELNSLSEARRFVKKNLPRFKRHKIELDAEISYAQFFYAREGA